MDLVSDWQLRCICVLSLGCHGLRVCLKIKSVWMWTSHLNWRQSCSPLSLFSGFAFTVWRQWLMSHDWAFLEMSRLVFHPCCDACLRKPCLCVGFLDWSKRDTDWSQADHRLYWKSLNQSDACGTSKDLLQQLYCVATSVLMRSLQANSLAFWPDYVAVQRLSVALSQHLASNSDHYIDFESGNRLLSSRYFSIVW